MTNLRTSPRPVTSIGKREALAWLLKQLSYERMLARLRADHAEHPGDLERGVAA